MEDQVLQEKWHLLQKNYLLKVVFWHILPGWKGDLKVQKAYQTFGSQCILIVCQDRRNPLIRPFDKKCSGDLDIGIVCDHMMLAARELNIGSVMVGLFDPKVIRKEFNIPEYIEPTALIILGYPSEGFLSPDRHKTERKPRYSYV